MAKALSGINVLEFHSNLGAACAAMLLAEQGGVALLAAQVRLEYVSARGVDSL